MQLVASSSYYLNWRLRNYENGMLMMIALLIDSTNFTSSHHELLPFKLLHLSYGQEKK